MWPRPGAAVMKPTSYTSPKSLHLVAPLFLTFASRLQTEPHCFNMEVLSEMQDSQERVVSSANADWTVYSVLHFGCSLVMYMQAFVQVTGTLAWSCRSCAWRCVSFWKPRLPCPCDPYGHCQRPCQGSALYQLACFPRWLSLAARGGEERRKEKGRGSLFVCLLACFCFI